MSAPTGEFEKGSLKKCNYAMKRKLYTTITTVFLGFRTQGSLPLPFRSVSAAVNDAPGSGKVQKKMTGQTRKNLGAPWRYLLINWRAPILGAAALPAVLSVHTPPASERARRSRPLGFKQVRLLRDRTESTFFQPEQCLALHACPGSGQFVCFQNSNLAPVVWVVACA